MSDPESKEDAQAPEPQMPDTSESGTAPESAAEGSSRESIVTQARKFLAADEVRDASEEKKTAFLKSKGVSDEDIRQLLGEQESAAQATTTQPQQPTSMQVPGTASSAASSWSPPSATAAAAASMPPIITYPEFLTAPTKPPPLITPSRLLATLYGSTVLGALAYGTSKFIVNPMLQTQAEARTSLASAADSKLTHLVDKLEGVVSVVPPYPSPSRPLPTASLSLSGPKKRRLRTNDDGSDTDSDSDDAFSTASDPTELFHRDYGTQTTPSLPTSPALPPAPITSTTPRTDSTTSLAGSPHDASSSQAHRITRLSASLKTIASSLDPSSPANTTNASATSSENIGRHIDLLREELERLTYPAPGTGYGSVSSYSIYGGGGGVSNAYGLGGAGSREPDDGIKKFRDEIRRVKGALLAARTFPATTGLSRAPR